MELCGCCAFLIGKVAVREVIKWCVPLVLAHHGLAVLWMGVCKGAPMQHERVPTSHQAMWSFGTVRSM